MKRQEDVKTIDVNISRFSIEFQEILKNCKQAISKEGPITIEIIKYGLPIFVLNKNLIQFEGFSKYVGFYRST